MVEPNVNGGVFDPDPPAPEGGAVACFWDAPVNASEICGDDPLLSPGFWDANSRLDYFYIGTPSAAPVLNVNGFAEEDYPWGVDHMLIYGETLNMDLNFSPWFSSDYSGTISQITVHKCDKETGEELQTYDIDDVEWFGDADYPLTGMPTIDPAYAWYATAFIDLIHSSTGNPVNGLVNMPILTARTVVLNSLNGTDAGDVDMEFGAPTVVGNRLWWLEPTVALYRYHWTDIVGAAIVEESTGNTAVVTIDGIEYNVTFDDIGAG